MSAQLERLSGLDAVNVPHYLAQTYWWAYVHPRAVHVFERQWLVNLILWGSFGRLRNAALLSLGDELPRAHAADRLRLWRSHGTVGGTGHTRQQARCGGRSADSAREPRAQVAAQGAGLAPWPMVGILRTLEPFTLDLWRNEVSEWCPPECRLRVWRRRPPSPGCYQMLVITK